MPDEMIIGIVPDMKVNIWVSRKRGILKLNIESEKISNVTTLDGLQDIEFNEYAYYRSPETGEIFFGGSNGINIFYPDSITNNPIPPDVYITGLQILNTPVNIGDTINGNVILNKNILMTDEITLTHKEKSFAIEFTDIHYANPGKNKYKYMLEGFDEQWINTTSKRRIASYSNLEPYTYYFKVRASNNDGI